MKTPYLEVTFRKGRPLAAYLYLPRHDGDKSARTQRFEHGILVDYAPDGRPIGLELTSPTAFSLEQLNSVLARIDQQPMQADDLKPLIAA